MQDARGNCGGPQRGWPGVRPQADTWRETGRVGIPNHDLPAPGLRCAFRRNGLAGRIPLDVPNLPHGVIVMDTGLNGILLPEGEEKRTIFLSAEPWVEAQRQTIYAIGRTETRSPLPTAFASEPAVLIIDPPEGVARRSF